LSNNKAILILIVGLMLIAAFMCGYDVGFQADVYQKRLELTKTRLELDKPCVQDITGIRIVDGTTWICAGNGWVKHY
jgi:hypothetical protein